MWDNIVQLFEVFFNYEIESLMGGDGKLFRRRKIYQVEYRESDKSALFQTQLVFLLLLFLITLVSIFRCFLP